MIGVGDLHLADLGDELRQRIVVVSNDRFHRRSDQVLVAPALEHDPDAILMPWRIPAGGFVYAVDMVASIPANRVLDRLGRLSASETTSIRQALRAIT